MDMNKPENGLSNIMGRKVRSGVNWQGTLKQEGIKQDLGAVKSVVHTRYLQGIER